MHRVSVIDNERSSPGRRRSLESTHPIAQCYQEEIAQILQGPILPSTFGTPFQVRDAPLYVARRQVESASVSDSVVYAAENSLYRHMCARRTCLLCPIAREGVGKSTFIRFFFDCYIPYIRKPVLSDYDADLTLFVSPLVLYSNLQAANTETILNQRLYRDLRTQIRIAYPMISVQDDYAMWSRVVDWSDPLHSEAVKSYETESAYRADVITRKSLGDDDFVNEALWYLTSQDSADSISGADLPKSADATSVIITLDNVDQLDEHLQLYVINLCRAWLAAGASADHPTSQGPPQRIPLKVVVPLRPETLASLEPAVRPVQQRAVLELGEVSPEDLLETRKQALRSHVAASERFVELDGRASGSDTIVFSPLAPWDAADVLAEMLTYDIGETADGGSTVRYSIARRVIDGLCDGSTSRALTARWRIVNSIALQRESQSESDREDRLVGNYAMLCALILGNRNYYNAADPTNLVVNLYHVADGFDPPYSTLLGVHTLHVLRSQPQDYDNIVSLLTQVGYLRSEIEGCLNVFCRAQIISMHDNSEHGRKYELNKSISAVHDDLMSRAAYVDNMALVTPVEARRIGSMDYTVSYSDDDFVNRVATSLEFLSQLESDENAFCRYSGQNGRISLPYERFAEVLDGLALPSAYRVAALGYRKRLEGIKADSKAFARRFGGETWERLINSPVLNVNDEQAKFPLVAIPKR